MEAETYTSPIGSLQEVQELIAVRSRLLEKISEIETRLREFAETLTLFGIESRYYPSPTEHTGSVGSASAETHGPRRRVHDVIRRRETAEGL